MFLFKKCTNIKNNIYFVHASLNIIPKIIPHIHGEVCPGLRFTRIFRISLKTLKSVSMELYET